MKKLAAILCLTALATGAFAQGLIKFANSSTTLISAGGAVATGDTFYYALLSAPEGILDPHSPQFVWSGLYATNTATAGRLQGGSLLGVAANSTWGPAVSRQFFVAGWSSALGLLPADLNQANALLHSWIDRQFTVSSGFFGISDVAFGRSGGVDPVTQVSYPAMATFAGTAITRGFNMDPVPEPATLALAGLGAAALLIFRRRK